MSIFFPVFSLSFDAPCCFIPCVSKAFPRNIRGKSHTSSSSALPIILALKKGENVEVRPLQSNMKTGNCVCGH